MAPSNTWSWGTIYRNKFGTVVTDEPGMTNFGATVNNMTGHSIKTHTPVNMTQHIKYFTKLDNTVMSL